MRSVFEDEGTEAILLVDASNAFNTLNRQAALRNVQNLCPVLAPILVNTYRNHAKLFIGGEHILSREGTTQGDPLAMAMYGIGTLPLILQLRENVTQCWYADDATAGGKLLHIRAWWEKVVSLGPQYGYHPNPTKTCLIVKPEHLQDAENLFSNTGIKITVQGHKHLGSPLGTRAFVEEFVRSKVDGWVTEIEKLSEIATFQPQAAYAAFTHGLTSRWTFLMRTVPGIEELLHPLEDAIRHQFLPAITGKQALNDTERDLLSLPARSGGLGVTNPSKTASQQFGASKKVTEPLVSIIHQQSINYPDHIQAHQRQAKKAVRNCNRIAATEEAEAIKQRLSSSQQVAMDQASERGASSWLTAIPIAEYGFTLHKQAFRDALCIRYGRRPARLPSHCPCGVAFSVSHALSCPKGALPSIRHDRIRDITAELLTEVCPNVAIEPTLQPLSGERFSLRSTNIEDEARLDIKAQDFWNKSRSSTFFDVRVFNPYAPSNNKSTAAACYRKHEMEKRRKYERRVLDVEHGSFTPLVFSTSGGWGPSATVTFRRLASLISNKVSQSYSATLGFIRCKIAFSLIDSAVMCLRGARSSIHNPSRDLNLHSQPLDLIANEARWSV